MTTRVEADDLVTDKVREIIKGGFVTQAVLVLEYVDETSGERFYYRAWNTDSVPWARIGLCRMAVAEMERNVAEHMTFDEGDD